MRICLGVAVARCGLPKSKLAAVDVPCHNVKNIHV
jgi:hypothetical protein